MALVHFSGLESLIESIYLEEDITENIGQANIIVNPENTNYMTGRTVILTRPDYPVDLVKKLRSQRCLVISRVQTDIPDVVIQGYILRVMPGLVWNGYTLDLRKEKSIDDVIEKIMETCVYDSDKKLLLLPKVLYNKEVVPVLDEKGRLTTLGLAFQQVGDNIKQYTVFEDLDVLKTKKMKL